MKFFNIYSYFSGGSSSVVPVLSNNNFFYGKNFDTFEAFQWLHCTKISSYNLFLSSKSSFIFSQHLILYKQKLFNSIAEMELRKRDQDFTD